MSEQYLRRKEDTETMGKANLAVLIEQTRQVLGHLEQLQRDMLGRDAELVPGATFRLTSSPGQFWIRSRSPGTLSCIELGDRSVRTFNVRSVVPFVSHVIPPTDPLEGIGFAEDDGPPSSY